MYNLKHVISYYYLHFPKFKPNNGRIHMQPYRVVVFLILSILDILHGLDHV